MCGMEDLQIKDAFNCAIAYPYYRKADPNQPK
jgi:hypothetical protein